MTSLIKYDRDYEDYSILSNPAQLKKLLPYYPDCTSTLRGTQHPYTLHLPRKKALLHSYIQLNPEALYTFLVLDIDREFNACDLWEYDGLPVPYFVAYNRENGHAHVIYVLRKPVCKTSLGHVSVLKYLDAIVRAYTVLAGADGSYAGHLAKNPWSEAWRVIQTGQAVYDLSGLVTGRVIDLLEEKPTRRPREEIAGLGRNCYIFEKVRTWAYRAVREYRQEGEEWYSAVSVQCEILNGAFSPCLAQSEVNQIARSIAKWVWRHITPEGFALHQRGLIKRRWDKESRKAEGIAMFKAGFSVDEVSDLLNVSCATVYRWRGEIPEMRHAKVSEARPWLDLGISRATWYRQQRKNS